MWALLPAAALAVPWLARRLTLAWEHPPPPGDSYSSSLWEEGGLVLELLETLRLLPWGRESTPLLGAAVFFLASLGAWTLYGKIREGRAAVWLAAAAAAFFLFFGEAASGTEFRSGAAPFAVLLAAVGVESLHRNLLPRLEPRALAAGAGILAVLSGTPFLQARVLQDPAFGYAKTAGAREAARETGAAVFLAGFDPHPSVVWLWLVAGAPEGEIGAGRPVGLHWTPRRWHYLGKDLAFRRRPDRRIPPGPGFLAAPGEEAPPAVRLRWTGPQDPLAGENFAAPGEEPREWHLLTPYVPRNDAEAHFLEDLRQGDRLWRLGRKEEAAARYAAADAPQGSPLLSAMRLFRLARSAAAAGQEEEALAAYGALFRAGYPFPDLVIEMVKLKERTGRRSFRLRGGGAP